MAIADWLHEMNGKDFAGTLALLVTLGFVGGTGCAMVTDSGEPVASEERASGGRPSLFEPSDGEGGSGGAQGSGSGGSLPSGGAAGVGGAFLPASGGQATGGAPAESIEIRVLSYNIYGHATMPQEAATYAAKINSLDIDVLGIQEGVHDWQVPSPPTDYSRAEALQGALNAGQDCWDRRFQVFVNTCRGGSFVSHERFDLTDGPNAVRTGEVATLEKGGRQLTLLDVHWDHENAAARAANASETASVAEESADPVIVVGDLNTGCSGSEAMPLQTQGGLSLVVGSGIDCIFARGITGSGQEQDGAPSDHPAVLATFSF